MSFNLFNKDYIKKSIHLTGTIRGHKNGPPLIVRPDKINQLLQDNHCNTITKGNKVYKVLRFLLRTNGELVFAHEGYPSGLIPAHWHMAGTTMPLDAKCITAGNVFFDEENNLRCINHKSGDFRPPFDSLQFVFPELIKAKIPLANKLAIQRLNSSGVQEQTYEVDSKDILSYYGSQEYKDKQENFLGVKVDEIPEKIHIQNTDSDGYTKDLNHDLKLLKQFHDKKLALNVNNQYGFEYNQSVINFYNKAVEIRKSGLPLKEVSQRLVQLAHDQFQHRHSTRRLVADALLVISCLCGGLGLLIGIGRVAMGHTFFFSCEMTSREKDFAQNWIKKNVEDDPNRGHILNNPVSVASA